MAKGFGRIEKRRQKLEARKDWLSELNRIMDWEIFRSCLDRLPGKERKSKAGRKPIDRMLLLKMLILQLLYNLSFGGLLDWTRMEKYPIPRRSGYFAKNWAMQD